MNLSTTSIVRIQHLVIKICVCDLVEDVELLPGGELLVADCAREAPQMEHLAITIVTRTLSAILWSHDMASFNSNGDGDGGTME